MNDTERRLRIAMLDKKISRQELAQKVGIKVTTLGNIIRGSHCSLPLRKKIQAALGVRIWEDVPREVHLGKNVEFVFPTVKRTSEFIEQCEREIGPGVVFRRTLRCRTVGLLKEIVLVKEDAESQPSGEVALQQSANNRKLLAGSLE